MRAITLLLLSPAFPSGIIALLHLQCPLVAYPSRVSTAYALVGRRVGFIYRESENEPSRILTVARCPKRPRHTPLCGVHGRGCAPRSGVYAPCVAWIRSKPL